MDQLLFFVFEFIRIIKLLFTHSVVVAFLSLKEQKFPAEISLILTQKINNAKFLCSREYDDHLYCISCKSIKEHLGLFGAP